MSIQGQGGGELPPMPRPEIRTVKPPEVKAPEVKPLGQPEQAMVARIDKDGDPDLVLQDLVKAEVPQATKSPSMESRVLPSQASPRNPEEPGEATTAANQSIPETGEINAKKEFGKLYTSADSAIASFKRLYGDNPQEAAQQAVSAYERSVRLRVAQSIVDADRTKAEQLSGQDAYIKEVLDLDAQLQAMQDRPSLREQNGTTTPNPGEDPNIQAIQRKIAMHPRRLERDILKGLSFDPSDTGKDVRKLLTEVYAITPDPRKQFTDFTKVASHYDPIAFEYYSTLQGDQEHNVQDINGLGLYEQFVAKCPQSAEAYKDFPPIQQARDRLEKRKVFEEQRKQAQEGAQQSSKELQQDTSSETAQSNAHRHEIRSVISVEEVRQRIKEQIPDSIKALTIDDLNERRQKLKNRPQIGSKALTDTLVGVDQQSTFAWVQTDKIVGRTWEQPDSWASEIEARKGRAAQVAKEIIDSDGNLQAMEHVFHPDKASERIKLIAIDGPAGPMYYVDDGTHRVAASMTARLAEIPCDVKNIRYPLEQIATDDYQAEDWQRKIEIGLIDGEIQDYTSNNGNKLKKLVVRSEVLPWIRTASQADLIKISRIYEQLYPGSLNNLKIPREALIDPIANNFFMAERWEEWTQRQTQQKYVVTRNGQITEVALDQVTPEERAALEEPTEFPKFQQNPVEDPAGFFDYLKQRNTNYTYDSDFTPEMVRKAVEWAQSKGFGLSELSPAQIRLAQKYVPGTKTQEEVAEEVIEERTVRLVANKEELASILQPTGTEYFHATPVFENVQSILENGLYCDSTLGLSGSAAPLDSVPPDADQATRDQITEANAKKLADPHEGYRYEVIIDLPPLTPEQQVDYQARRARDEKVSYTSCYVQRLAEQVGAQGVEITYNAVLPPQYIKGFIDLDTGQFIPRQQTSV